MTLVSNDPSLWPFINAARIGSYFTVSASAALIYDWALTFGQEVELIWRQHWSLMTVLYLSVRYLGIIYIVLNIQIDVPTISVTDVGCHIMNLIQDSTTVVVTAILGVIMTTRLYAMYQRSRKVLILLAVVFLTVNIACGVIAGISLREVSAEELILSGTYQCDVAFEGDFLRLDAITWILNTVWEVLALCLAVWIAVKHFCELRRQSAGGIIGDCFRVLIKTHVGYFASFVGVSCFHLVLVFSPILTDASLQEIVILSGFLEMFELVQMFVLGPRLILSIREYHAKLVTDFDTATAMISIAFQERVHVSTSSSV